MKYGAMLQNGVRPQPDEQLNFEIRSVSLFE